MHTAPLEQSPQLVFQIFHEHVEDRAHSRVATMISTDRCRQQRDSLQHKTHRIMQGARRNHVINDVHFFMSQATKPSDHDT